MAKKNWKTETISLLETQLDDITGQEVGYLLKKLLQKGALDALCIPVLMKKGRPGYLVQILCQLKDRDRLCEILFDETPTLGVRFQNIQRNILERKERTIPTSQGPIRVKERVWKKKRELVPEFEDLVALTDKKGASLRGIKRKMRLPS